MKNQCLLISYERRRQIARGAMKGIGTRQLYQTLFIEIPKNPKGIMMAGMDEVDK